MRNLFLSHRYMFFLTLCVVWFGSFPAYAAEKAKLFQVARHYGVYWSGFYIGDVVAEVKETAPSQYRLQIALLSRKLGKLIPVYRNDAVAVSARSPKGEWIPVFFEMTSSLKRRVKYSYVSFGSKGDLQIEAAFPAPTAKVILPKWEDKTYATDPLSAALRVWEKVLSYQKNNGISVKDAWPVYEGRKLFNVHIHKMEHDVEESKKTVEVTLSRTPLGGFSKRELRNAKREEPVLHIWFEDTDMALPLKAEAKALIGSASATLKHQCESFDACMKMVR